MNVTYTIHGSPKELDVDDENDVKALLGVIEAQLRDRHVEADRNPNLLPVLATRLVNALADDQTEIALGELAAS